MDCLRRVGLLALGVIALTGTVAEAQGNSVRSFMPQNDLWMEDNLNAASSVDEATFRAIITAGHEVYDSFAAANNEQLVINERWTDATVNANCGRRDGTVTVNMYGGLARRSEVTPEGFALVLCHELAHAYGGTPYIRAQSRMSAEGQADYYGSSECADKVLAKIPSSIEPGTESPYAVAKCSEKFPSDTQGYSICVRRMNGALSLGTLLSTLMHEKTPTFETPDTSVVAKTEVSYPNTVQCRVDTMHNGILGFARPTCWFKD